LEHDASFTASPTPRGKAPSLLTILADPSDTRTKSKLEQQKANYPQIKMAKE